MKIAGTKAAFDTAATAAGMKIAPTAGADLATQDAAVGGGVEVQVMTATGVKYLRWTLHYDVPDNDILCLLVNLVAAQNAKTTAWTQT